jgi:hypothetical protein
LFPTFLEAKLAETQEKPKKTRRGGYRQGAGRKPGSLNQTTLKKQARLAAEVKTALEIASGIDVDGMSATDVIRLAMRTLVRAGDLTGAAVIAVTLAPYESPRFASVVPSEALPADLQSDPRPTPDEPVPELIE